MRRRDFLALGLGAAACLAGCATAQSGTASGAFSVVAGGESWAPVAACLIQAARRAGYPVAAQGAATAITVTGLTALAAGELHRGLATIDTATPLARLTGDVEVVVVPSNSRYREFGDLAEQLIAEPELTPVAGGPLGGPDHLLFGLIAKGLGADTRQLDYTGYPGGEEAGAALLGGKVAAAAGTLAEWRPRIDQERVRVLAVSSAHRVDEVDAPSLLECGVRVDFANWCAAIGPPRMAEGARVLALRMCDDVSASATWLEACRTGGWRPLPLSGGDFAAWLASEIDRTRAVLGDLGLLDTTNTTCWGSCGNGH
ncbi:Bug family tripartite tricarboxylate transporter substrate binding protein [Nonomuraea sediminis]|uniref:Bug family tripartite tricarboxylate transporter substrate binding protein n=1 Tax=Nonomuraea sediminis TaxID=2835864 RepID=UPI001BDD0A42|nr:tripartite tricarboxylate transporter substrate-binding protein [Nonomuraea sediminis]